MSFYVDLESPPLPRAARCLPQPAQKASFAHGKAASTAASSAPSRGTFISKASPRRMAWYACSASVNPQTGCCNVLSTSSRGSCDQEACTVPQVGSLACMCARQQSADAVRIWQCVAAHIAAACRCDLLSRLVGSQTFADLPWLTR